jgi:ribosomal small subunit protein bTHX
MGKGDVKSRKGKLANGSFGKTRKRNETMPKVDKTAKAAVVSESAEATKKPARAKAKKAEK